MASHTFKKDNFSFNLGEPLMLQLQIQFWSQYNQSNYFKVNFKLNKYDKFVHTKRFLCSLSQDLSAS